MASKAFTAVPRAVIGMARDDEAEEDNVVVLSQIKSNLGPLDVPSLKFTFQQVTVETADGRGAHVGRLVELGESDRSVTEILAGRGDETDRETWNEAAWWLYDYVTRRRRSRRPRRSQRREGGRALQGLPEACLAETQASQAERWLPGPDSLGFRPGAQRAADRATPNERKGSTRSRDSKTYAPYALNG